MSLHDYHTVITMVKYRGHDWYRTANPFEWLWSDDGTGFWQPIVSKKFHCLNWWNETGPRCSNQCQMCADDE